MGWQLIQSQSLSASAASVTFSNIPQTYKTLRLAMSVRGTASGDTFSNLWITFNGTSTNYSERMVYGNGSSALSAVGATARFNNVYAVGPSATSLTFSNIMMEIPNYTSSTNKPISIDCVTENNGTSALQVMNAGLWSNVNAITSIAISQYTANLDFGSTFTLYGLL